MSEHVALNAPSQFTLAEAAREIANGATSAFVLLALMLPLGLIAFGQHFENLAVEAAVRAAFAAAIFGNLTAAVLGAPLLPNEIPRASTVFVFAAFTARLATDDFLRRLPGGGIAEIVLLCAACVALAGIFQVVFGTLRLGNLARFVPYPVVAGLMTGLAVALIVYELPEILGTHGGGHGGHGLNPWTLLLAAFTITVVVVVRRSFPRSPSKMVGVALGTLLAVILARLIPHIDLGPPVPMLGGNIPMPDALIPLLSREELLILARFRWELLVSAATIAVVGSLDSLVAAVGEGEGPLDTSHRPNRLLVCLGLGNIVSGLFGGVPLAYSSHHSMVSHRGGTLKLVGSLATTLTLVALLRFGAPLLQSIPLAVLSGIMLMLAFGLIDRWASATLHRARRRQYDRELWLNLFVVAFVAWVTVQFTLVQAVLTGLVLSMGLFVAAMNRSLVRSVSTGLTRASRRIYPTVPASVLRAEGGRIRVIEVDGAIFFGTADRLAAEALRAAEGASFLILDLRRVTTIDASGGLMLDKLSKRLAADHTKLLLAHVSATSPLGLAILAAGAFPQRYHPDWFADTDHALEWAEHQLLVEAHVDDTRREIRLSEFSLMANLSEADLERIKPYLDRQLFPARSALFRDGDPGDRLFLLASGAVSIVAEDPQDKTKRRRVLTLAPGVMFGESVMLVEGTRIGTAIAEEESVTYSLSRKSLEAIRGIDRDLYEQLLLNMLAHVSGLLRMAAGVVRDASEAVE